MNKSSPASSAGGGGFTLIELTVVLCIVILLVIAAFPVYQEAVRKSRRAEARAALLSLMQQQERFMSLHNSYIAFSADASDENERQFKWFSGSSPRRSAYEISGAACKEDVIRNCVLLTAKPGTERVDQAFRDPACNELSLNSRGVKSASGSAANCWD
jgi:type IV pilus assembly protein PilE